MISEENAVSFPLPNASSDLSGQVALVTGASVGLGRRFALTLAAAGADVAVAARRVDKLKDLAAEIEALGRRCVPVPLDMTDADQIVAAVQTAEDALDTVTILVNNAGVTDAMRAHKMPLELIDSVIDTNIRGPYVLSCEVARRLIAAKKPGRIVNLSSMGAYSYSGAAAATLYSVSKAAIARMTEVLAVEWVRYGINVNAMAPGLVYSEMTDGMISRIGDPSESMPRKRIGHPAQLDSTLLYLVAPSSEFVTGTIVKVDDGQGPR
jgi:NAD(P)-dependent dehydrogenase (short-subunit alcohol dehydrogenase family)